MEAPGARDTHTLENVGRRSVPFAFEPALLSAPVTEAGVGASYPGV